MLPILCFIHVNLGMFIFHTYGVFIYVGNPGASRMGITPAAALRTFQIFSQKSVFISDSSKDTGQGHQLKSRVRAKIKFDFFQIYTACVICSELNFKCSITLRY